MSRKFQEWKIFMEDCGKENSKEAYDFMNENFKSENFRAKNSRCKSNIALFYFFSCISLDEMCDGWAHCPGGTDEDPLHCSWLVPVCLFRLFIKWIPTTYVNLGLDTSVCCPQAEIRSAWHQFGFVCSRQFYVSWFYLSCFNQLFCYHFTIFELLNMTRIMTKKFRVFQNFWNYFDPISQILPKF